jgi:hypothetical protein
MAAVQARTTEAAGKDKWLRALTDGDETDDVAFLLMASPACVGRSPPRSLASQSKIIDPLEKETSLVRVSLDWLSIVAADRPNRLSMVPT